MEPFMSLKDMYDNALSNTYVGMVRTRQEASAPTNQTLVNFLDGQPRGTYSQGATPPQDQIQTGFARNSAGSYILGGAQGIVRSENLTRWKDKALDIAFGKTGPTQLENGFYTNQFRLDNAGNQVHMYTPPASGRRNTFVDKNEWARDRKNSSPSGAPTNI
jgi:hypothetical protein